MTIKHIVAQGETLSSLASAYGLRNYRLILDHPDNAQLKAERDAHVLFPGDEVAIPELEKRLEDRATDQSHRFVADALGVLLHLKLLDVDGAPLKNILCDIGLDAGASPDPVVTGPDGMLEHPLPADSRKGEVLAHMPPKDAKAPEGTPGQDVKYDLLIGSLNPENKLSGQQARLNNLGYFAGYDLRDLDQLLWAAEEFDCETSKKRVEKRPSIAPAPRSPEDGSEVGDPVTPTGIQDKALVQRLKTRHGI